MKNQGDDLIQTKATLLGRLKNSKDQSSWREFFDTYSNLIYGIARKAGLNEAEARDVLEATMAAVAGHMPRFRYDPNIGSFKAWLRNLTRLQIISLSLKRRSAPKGKSGEKLAVEADASAQTLDRMWETEWEINLLNAAVANVKRRLDPQKYQIYDLYLNKKWSPEKIAGAFGMSVEEVGLAKDKITEMIKTEATRLEQQML
jgi:RNA polymerase sigma-70 factor (ECF subfamily)